MANRDSVVSIILRAVENLNNELEEGAKIAVSGETKLFGPDAALDSLALVSVIVDVEQMIGDEFDEPISLTDDRAMSREISPFTDVQALADYAVELLTEAGR